MLAEEELTDPEIEEMKLALLSLQVELQSILETASDRTDVVDLDQEIGRLSRMDALQQQKMAEAEQARHKVRLKAIKLALIAVEEGDYGFCKRCGEPIDIRRLRARPESPCCVPCLRLVESR